MNKNRPSKKIIAFAIICGGLILSVLVWRFFESHPNFSLFSFAKDASGLTELSYSAKGVSPIENSDADASGGEAVANTTTNSSSTPPQNASDVFSEDLFSKFMNLNSDGSINDADTQQNFASSMAEEAQTAFVYKLYDGSGIHTFSSSEKDTVKFYASTFATLQLNFLLKLQAASTKVQTDDDLGLYVKIYSDFANALYAVAVPAELFQNHLAIVNNISTISAVFDDIKNYKKDPVAAIASIQAYQKAQADQITELSAIALYLRNNDIIFTTDQDGNFWNNF